MNVMAFLGLRFDPNLVDIVANFLVFNMPSLYNSDVRLTTYTNYAFEIVTETESKVFTVQDAENKADALVKFCIKIRDKITIDLNTKIIIYGGEHNSYLNITEFVELLYDQVLNNSSVEYENWEVASRWIKKLCDRLQQLEEKKSKQISN